MNCNNVLARCQWGGETKPIIDHCSYECVHVAMARFLIKDVLFSYMHMLHYSYIATDCQYCALAWMTVQYIHLQDFLFLGYI